MPGALTYDAANARINHFLRGVSQPSPGTVYIALLSAVTDGDAGVVTELAGGGYARQVIVFGAPTQGESVNTNLIQYPVASANWAPVVAAAIYESLSGGTPKKILTLDQPQTVLIGGRLEFAPGAVIWRET